MFAAGSICALPATAQMQLGSQQQQLLSLEIKTNQFDRTRHFYIDVVGLKELPGSSPAGRPKQSSSLSFGGTYVDSFITITHSESDGTNALKRGALQRLTFKVTDARAIVVRARAAGITIVREPQPAHGIPDLIVAVLSDPDGNLIELVQPPSQ